MGFRNPVLTAVDPDARAAAANAQATADAAAAAAANVTTVIGTLRTTTDPNAGSVSIYEVGTAWNPQRSGVVEFADGFPGDAPAQVFQHAAANPRANTSQSGGLTLAGGSYGGTTAPTLDLFVLADPTGTGNPATTGATLTGGPLTVDRPIGSSGAGEQWHALPFGPAWVAWDTTASAPSYRRDASGECHIRGMVKLATGQTIAAGATLAIANMPAGFFLSGARLWRSAVVLNPSAFAVGVVPAWIETGGALTVYNTTGAALSAGFGVSLSLSYPTT